MIRIATRVLAITAVVFAAGCTNRGDSASPPATIQVSPGDNSAVVTFAADPNVQYWLFYAPSPDLNSTNFNTLPGGNLITDAVSPQLVPGLQNGTTYYFTMNGRTNNGPGGAGTNLVSATPRPAGATWNVGQGLTFDGDLRGITYGAGFVAVGANGAMFSTLDGVSWYAINYVVSSDLNAVFYGAGRYVAVGAGGVILQSSDGVSWGLVGSGTTADLYAGFSNGAAYIAVGANGVYTGSADAQTWTPGNAGTSKNLYGVAFGNNEWVAVGASGTIVASRDGAVWNPVVSQTTSDLKAVAYSVTAATFVAVGANGTVVTSPDGINWTSRGPIGSETLDGVAYGSQFAAVADNGSIFTSTDGITWQPAASGTTGHLNAVAFGNYRFIATGAAGLNLIAN